MKHAWQYSETIKRQTSTGQVGINIYPAKQQNIENLIIMLKDITGANTGGSSETTIMVTFGGFNVHQLYDNETDGDLIVPSDDYVSSFKKLNLEKLQLTDGDYMTIVRTRFAVDGTLKVGIRAMLSNYALPTITYYTTDTIRQGLNYNKIIGVIE